jgi:hypothetical protein
MPIVFFRNSLLGRLSEGPTAGCIDSLDEARIIIKRVIDGDVKFVEWLRNGQRHVSHRFSDAYCRPTWEKNLIESGLGARLHEERQIRVCVREALRFGLAPAAKGLASVPSRRRLTFVPSGKLLTPLENQSDGGTIEQGIDFTRSAYPRFVLGTNGISYHEFWGRWSVGKQVSIFLNHPLQKRFSLLITGGGHGPNLGAQFKVRIGNVSRYAAFRKGVADPETLRLEFSVRTPSNVIEISVPHPTVPEQDSRAIGLGFVQMRIAGELST